MKIVQVIPHYVRVHKDGKRQMSIYGAGPVDPENWTTVQKGWTHELEDGTTGLGRRPCATYEEAVKVMHRFNSVHEWG